jgi:AcrR family transcriptional regulator
MTAVADVRDQSMRERILVAAEELTIADGFGALTMTRLASQVGVSRQTIYNEVGSKPELAEAMVLEQLAAFLQVVEDAFDRHPDDAVVAIRGATRAVLTLAQQNALLRAVVSSSHGGDNDLLPFLTTRSDSLLDAARSVLMEQLHPLTPSLSRRERAALVDMVVRTVLSHVMQPTGSPAASAASVGLVMGRVLGAAPGAMASRH